MRSLSTTATVLIAGLLALLLIAFVFVGESGGDRNKAPRCLSPTVLDQVKNELFRRAAALRGSNEPAFAGVTRHSAVRGASRIYRKHHKGSGKVTCSGAIAIDLPPGVTAAGGHSNLSSKIVYQLEPEGGGGVRLVALSKAEEIVAPLAGLGQATAPEQQIGADDVEPVASERVEEPTPKEAPPSEAAPPPPASSPARRVEPPKPAPAPPKRQAEAPKRKAPAAQPTVSTIRRPAPAPAPVASARPSFNCRYARTRGEVAVCRSPGLAILDRQMSGQFYSALTVARPGQRAMLQRSRSRFLRVRDSCGSEACVAASYRARMAEISAIMSGAF